MCIHFYSYCYPTVFYTGYNYSLSNDFILAAIYVSLSLISIIQRFRNTGDTIYTKTKPLPPFFEFTFLLRYLTSFLSHYILSTCPPPSPSSFFFLNPSLILPPMFPSPSLELKFTVSGGSGVSPYFLCVIQRLTKPIHNFPYAGCFLYLQ